MASLKKTKIKEDLTEHIIEDIVLEEQELIAEEIEDPFGGDSNDLPTDRMAMNIHHNVSDIFR